MSNYDAVILLHREKLCCPHQVLFPAETPDGQFRFISTTVASQFPDVLQKYSFGKNVPPNTKAVKHNQFHLYN
jgi:hypothetical protein